MNSQGYEDYLLERHLDAHDEPMDPGGRSAFERDRDRVLYSSAFRSLAGKTQVVASTELGHLHNRLTHSLKVAQLGKAIAHRLAQRGAEVDPVLVETACLAHDIGHPPFGHAGEEALDDTLGQMRLAERGDDVVSSDSDPRPERDSCSPKDLGSGGTASPWDGFEGNAQNLRVLTRLASHKNWVDPGLHLTRASLLATTKYPWTRRSEIKGGRKWGAYEGDKEALDWMLSPLDFDLRPPPMFEQQVMDWADDVTYAVHDVEDWYRQGHIPLDRLFAFNRPANHPSAHHDASDELREFLAWVKQKWDDATFDEDDIIRKLHFLADCVHVTSPYDGKRASKGAVEATVSDLIGFFVNTVDFSDRGVAYQGNLVIPPDRRILCDVLQELVWYYVIQGPALASQQHGQKRMIKKLMSWIQEDWQRLLPPDRLAEIQAHQDVPRAIADHISSLTEPMATSLFGKLSGNALGSITDNL